MRPEDRGLRREVRIRILLSSLGPRASGLGPSSAPALGGHEDAGSPARRSRAPSGRRRRGDRARRACSGDGVSWKKRGHGSAREERRVSGRASARRAARAAASLRRGTAQRGARLLRNGRARGSGSPEPRLSAELDGAALRDLLHARRAAPGPARRVRASLDELPAGRDQGGCARHLEVDPQKAPKTVKWYLHGTAR